MKKGSQDPEKRYQETGERFVTPPHLRGVVNRQATKAPNRGNSKSHMRASQKEDDPLIDRNSESRRLVDEEEDDSLQSKRSVFGGSYVPVPSIATQRTNESQRFPPVPRTGQIIRFDNKLVSNTVTDDAGSPLLLRGNVTPDKVTNKTFETIAQGSPDLNNLPPAPASPLVVTPPKNSTKQGEKTVASVSQSSLFPPRRLSSSAPPKNSKSGFQETVSPIRKAMSDVALRLWQFVPNQTPRSLIRDINNPSFASGEGGGPIGESRAKHTFPSIVDIDPYVLTTSYDDESDKLKISFKVLEDTTTKSVIRFDVDVQLSTLTSSGNVQPGTITFNYEYEDGRKEKIVYIRNTQGMILSFGESNEDDEIQIIQRSEIDHDVYYLLNKKQVPANESVFSNDFCNNFATLIEKLERSLISRFELMILSRKHATTVDTKAVKITQLSGKTIENHTAFRAQSSNISVRYFMEAHLKHVIKFMGHMISFWSEELSSSTFLMRKPESESAVLITENLGLQQVFTFNPEIGENVLLFDKRGSGYIEIKATDSKIEMVLFQPIDDDAYYASHRIRFDRTGFDFVLADKNDLEEAYVKYIYPGNPQASSGSVKRDHVASVFVYFVRALIIYLDLYIAEAMNQLINIATTRVNADAPKNLDAVVLSKWQKQIHTMRYYPNGFKGVFTNTLDTDYADYLEFINRGFYEKFREVVAFKESFAEEIRKAKELSYTPRKVLLTNVEIDPDTEFNKNLVKPSDSLIQRVIENDNPAVMIRINFLKDGVELKRIDEEDERVIVCVFRDNGFEIRSEKKDGGRGGGFQILYDYSTEKFTVLSGDVPLTLKRVEKMHQYFVRVLIHYVSSVKEQWTALFTEQIGVLDKDRGNPLVPEIIFAVTRYSEEIVDLLKIPDYWSTEFDPRPRQNFKPFERIGRDFKEIVDKQLSFGKKLVEIMGRVNERFEQGLPTSPPEWILRPSTARVLAPVVTRRPARVPAPGPPVRLPPPGPPVRVPPPGPVARPPVAVPPVRVPAPAPAPVPAPAIVRPRPHLAEVRRTFRRPVTQAGIFHGPPPPIARPAPPPQHQPHRTTFRTYPGGQLLGDPTHINHSRNKRS
jgi:hypothetical protein